MLKLLARIGCIVAGLFMIAELLLPARFESATIQRHERSSAFMRARSVGASDDYTIYLSGGKTSSCEVGRTAYQELKDGDAVRIKTSAILGNCFYVAAEHGAIYSDHTLNLTLGAAGLTFLLVGLGFLPLSFLRESKE